jgi:hypothetical protein
VGDCIASGGLPGGSGSTCATANCVIPNLDFGDAPDGPYQTLVANNGAAHPLGVSPVYLGVGVDAEPDGQPTPDADGDDLNVLYPGTPFPVGDEEGVVFLGPPVRGFTSRMLVTAGPGGGFLDAWIDFNHDGTWSASEQLGGGSMPVLAGSTLFMAVPTPIDSVLGPTYSRFRLSSTGGLSPYGLAPDGEVEDYPVYISQLGPYFTTIVITNIIVNPPAVTIEWVAETEVEYQLQREVTIGEPPTQVWINIGLPVIAPTNSQTDASAPASGSAYRVIARCGVIREACCRPNGQCTDVHVQDCAATGGTSQGSGTSCLTTQCPSDPMEACCVGFSCVDATPSDCMFVFFGDPQGPGSNCGNTLCSPF